MLIFNNFNLLFTILKQVIFVFFNKFIYVNLFSFKFKVINESNLDKSNFDILLNAKIYFEIYLNLRFLVKEHPIISMLNYCYSI